MSLSAPIPFSSVDCTDDADCQPNFRFNQQKRPDRVVVKTEGRFIFLELNEINWISADGNYVQLHVNQESYRVRARIGAISDKLNHTVFLRIHRSTIVNITKIKELQPCNRNEYILMLKDGKRLSCGSGYCLEVRKLIESLMAK